jgi:phage terminase large subunit-like protein
VLYPPLGLILVPWQRQIIRDLLGSVMPESGARSYKRAYVSTPKKNGKSFVSAGLPLYHLVMEPEMNPEAYGCASAKEQAGLVFKAAKRLVEANPILRSRLKVIASSKRIVRIDGAGYYQVLSADGDVQDGIEPSLLIRDEMHRWKGAKAETLYDVTTKGQISRPEPLDIAITTAGAEYESPLWWREYQLAKKKQEGTLKMDDFYVAIWEANREKLEEDPEYWKSREARVVANPSHEEHGGFLKDAAIVRELDKAILQPAEKSKYMRYHLNIPVQQAEDPIIEMSKWQACGGGDVDLRTWPIYDVELLLSKWGLVGKKCFAGVDASWTQDSTALVLGFPIGDSWTIIPFVWVPQEKLLEIERKTMIPLSYWVQQGFVTATPGNAIDLRSVKERIRWAHQMFDLQLIAYDRTNFRVEAMELYDQDGFEVKEVPQNFMRLNEPTKFLLTAYEDGKIRHGNNPVLNWHASCLQLQYDRKDLCQPTKPERLKSAKRIDIMQALITMWAEARAAEGNTMTYTGLRSLN